MNKPNESENDKKCKNALNYLKQSDLKQDKEVYKNQIKAITDQRQPQPAEPVQTVRKKILGIF
jgi:hypothetical protein